MKNLETRNLLTKTIITQLEKRGLYGDGIHYYSNENKDESKNLIEEENDHIDYFNMKVVVHYYIPFTACHWLILGGEKYGDTWLLFGLGHIFCGELGTVTLRELEKVGAVRDLVKTKTLKEMIKEWGLDRHSLYR
ncbi:MAG TPA: hypothetical protein VJ888_07995 [Mobilitalea sp.]|nr:hypothetical protein [Mobilitalea sp.]